MSLDWEPGRGVAELDKEIEREIDCVLHALQLFYYDFIYTSTQTTSVYMSEEDSAAFLLILTLKMITTLSAFRKATNISAPQKMSKT